MILNGKKCMKTRFFSNIECHIVNGLYIKYHKEMFIFENTDQAEKYPLNILCYSKLYIPSTIKIWKKVLTNAIWADKKWATDSWSLKYD